MLLPADICHDAVGGFPATFTKKQSSASHSPASAITL
jgi:hypothetical protein